MIVECDVKHVVGSESAVDVRPETKARRHG